MLTLAWPWMLATLPLPLLVRRWLPPAPDPGGPALHLPDWHPGSAVAMTAGAGRRWRWVLAWLAWSLLVVAAARPQWLGEPVTVPLAGRDLMLAVDISGSMEQRDFLLAGRPVPRLSAVKAVATRFIEGRQQDRIGLILFGSRAYLQTPLTFDRATVIRMLDDAIVGLAGRETAIGDAIALAVKRLREQPAEARVLILLTDGENNAGHLSPREATQLAVQAGVRLYVIGLGGPGSARTGPFGLVRPGGGGEVDAPGLTAIAKATGGRFFPASYTAALTAIYAELDRLEPTQREQAGYRPNRSLFHWPLAAALLLSTLLFLPLSPGPRRRAEGLDGAV